MKCDLLALFLVQIYQVLYVLWNGAKIQVLLLQRHTKKVLRISGSYLHSLLSTYYMLDLGYSVQSTLYCVPKAAGYQRYRH